MGTMGLALGPCSLPGQVNHHHHCALQLLQSLSYSSSTLHSGLNFTPASPFTILLSQGPLFTVAADAMELGLGVHGEAGVASMPLSNARFPSPSWSWCSSFMHLTSKFPKSSEMSHHNHLHHSVNHQWLTTIHARDAVKAILTHMTNPSSATALSLASSGERLAVIVNNLGGTSKLEELVRRLGTNTMWRHWIWQ